MATRFYFDHGTTSPVSPAYSASWNGLPDEGGLHKYLVPKLKVSVLNASAGFTTTVTSSATQKTAAGQFVSDVIPPQLITGTVSLVIKVSENNALCNSTLCLIVRVVSQAGDTVRGTLFSVLGTDTEFPLTASAATRIVNAQVVTAVTTQPGDRIVVEVGNSDAAPTASTFDTFVYGNNATSDYALTSALTTSLNPWIEFSQNIWDAPLNNYQFVKAGDGMSVSEKIR